MTCLASSGVGQKLVFTLTTLSTGVYSAQSVDQLDFPLPTIAADTLHIAAGSPTTSLLSNSTSGRV